MLKPDPDFDRMRDNAYAVTAEELRQIIERYEQLEGEKKEIAEEQKEVMAVLFQWCLALRRMPHVRLKVKNF